MDDGDHDPVRSAPRRRRLWLRVAVLVTVVGAAIGAAVLGSLAAGRPQHPVTHRLVYCDSIISFVQVGATPPEISGGRKVSLPGGGGLACGQLVVQPGGSEPVAVDLWTGSAGLSATMPGVQVMTMDLTDGRMTRMSFRSRQEYLLRLESDPNRADMFIYSGNGSLMLISLHLVFCPKVVCPSAK